VLDPSQNVADLVEDAIKRLDDLRHAEHDANHTAHKAVRAEMRMHAASLRREAKRESKAIRRETNLRAEYEEKLSLAESERLDSIRGVDVAASAADRVVQETRATTLATAQNASAEALRGQVATTAAAQTIALDNKIAPVQKDISDLREVQYKQQGERAQAIESRVDSRDSVEMLKPILDQLTLLQQVNDRNLGQQQQVVEQRAKGGSTGMWIGLGLAVAGFLVSSMLGIAGIVITLIVKLS